MLNNIDEIIRFNILFLLLFGLKNNATGLLWFVSTVSLIFFRLRLDKILHVFYSHALFDLKKLIK